MIRTTSTCSSGTTEQLRHNYVTDDMGASVPELIEFASTIMTLKQRRSHLVWDEP